VIEKLLEPGLRTGGTGAHSEGVEDHSSELENRIGLPRERVGKRES
jgi:hypothetical protein